MSEAELDTLKAELRLPFIGLFMDGRNEHGTHLLVSPPDRLGLRDKESETFIADQDEAERIFREAESAGHEDGHAIITIWRMIHDDEYSYWEYQRISPILTEVFFGSAADQKRERLEFEADNCDTLATVTKADCNDLAVTEPDNKPDNEARP